jgi:hypothetical protein
MANTTPIARTTTMALILPPVDNADGEPRRGADCEAMELAIRHDDLHAAAMALAGVTARLTEAGSTFSQRARVDVPEIGADAAAATTRGASRAAHAVEVITIDLDHVARALAALAQTYPRLDATAMSRR